MGKSLEIHGRDHRLVGSDPVNVVLHVKVFADATAVTAGDGARMFFIPSDMARSSLVEAQAGVTTVSSSGAVTVNIRNVTQGSDMLTTPITIDAGEETSYTAATASVANNVRCYAGDKLAVDVDGAGTGAKGLEVLLTFGG